jgi:hypothetical protein
MHPPLCDMVAASRQKMSGHLDGEVAFHRSGNALKWLFSDVAIHRNGFSVKQLFMESTYKWLIHQMGK